MHDLEGRTVVITGASSGIGRAAALAFAERGANVALAARREALLEEVAAECRRRGVGALAVPADVTRSDAMEALAAAAVRSFGGVDVWINNAGTGVFGPFVHADIGLHRRTIEVNLVGAMNGAAAVLPVFLRQRRGIMINNVSLGGFAPAPFAAAYTASKFGLRGFTASLRQELLDWPDIHVCAVFPAMIDTPGFVHGANVSGKAIDPGPLLYAPEDVAETFVRLARHPRDETAVGWPSRAAQLAYAVAPGLTERLTARAMRRLLRRAEPAPLTAGTLLRPSPEGSGTGGGWRERKGLPHSAADISRGLGIAALAAGAVLLGVGLARRR